VRALDAGRADERRLIRTTADPDEVERIADALG